MSGLDDVEGRLRAALRAEADGVEPQSFDSLDVIRSRTAAARRRRGAVALGVAAAVVLVAGLLVVPQLGEQRGDEVRTDPADGGSGTSSPAPAVTPPPAADLVAPVPPPTSDGSTAPVAPSFRYTPLWPFSSEAEVRQWQADYRAEGHQPWHLDARETALGFTTGYLGFTEIDRVVSGGAGGRDAHVAVGYATEGENLVTAAVVHLVRWGSGEDAPWEVVGTRDTDLTLETPAYGATVASPVEVGGHVTGVEGNLRVEVRQRSSVEPLGDVTSVPTSGEGGPWAATVDFVGAVDPALTIVVSAASDTGDVERFAITGVRPR